MINWGRWQDVLADFLFPAAVCPLCGTPGKYTRSLPWCGACEAARQREAAEEPSRDNPLSGSGIEKPAFQQAIHTAPYLGVTQAAIRQLKYHNGKFLAPRLAELMLEKIRENGEFAACEAVVPVPLTPEKEAQRGYNQSLLLAREIARGLGIPCLPDALCRVEDTLSQTRLNRTERLANVAEAFAPGRADVRGKTLLLTDDVLTTGATAEACSRALLKAGARAVYVVTAAAAGFHRPDSEV